MAGMINCAVEIQTPFSTTFKNKVWSTVAQCYVIKFLVCKGGNLNIHTVKPVLNSHSKIKKKTKNWLSRPSIAKCRSKQSILQYFRPSLSYHWSLRPLFCLFLSGCFRQVLLKLGVVWLFQLLRKGNQVLCIW